MSDTIPSKCAMPLASTNNNSEAYNARMQASRDRETIIKFNKAEKMVGAKLSTSIEDINRRWNNNIALVSIKAENHHAKHIEVMVSAIAYFNDGTTESQENICKYKAAKKLAEQLFYDDINNQRERYIEKIEFIVPGQLSKPVYTRSEYENPELTKEEKRARIKDDPRVVMLENPDLIPSRAYTASKKLPKCTKSQKNPQTTRVAFSRG